MFLPRFLDSKVQRFLEKKGYAKIRGIDSLALARRRRLLVSQNIDLVIDVGANIGQFALQMRELGYRGRIHSYEPMRNAWDQLKVLIDRDDLWSGEKMALGEKRGASTLHVALNSVSSSLLAMLPRHQANAPASIYVRDEEIQITSFDDEFKNIRQDAKNIWLKLDVQGYERSVLKGAVESLGDVRIVQIEMSLAPLYAGQAIFLEMVNLLNDAGFEPIGFEPGFQEPASGVVLQVDGIFRNYKYNESAQQGVAG